MTDENNPFKIALQNISHIKESITLFTCLLKLKELNKEEYFYNGEIGKSFLYSFLTKRYNDYYLDEVDFISFFSLCKKTKSLYMDINYLLNNVQVINEDNENNKIYLREKILKSSYHSVLFKKSILTLIDKKLLKKDDNFDSIIISFARNNEVGILQYLIDEKVIDVNDIFTEEGYEAPLMYYINSYTSFQKLINQNNNINLNLLSKKIIKSQDNNFELEYKYNNILQKIILISNRGISSNEIKKNKECFDNFKKTYEDLKYKINFEDTKNITQSFSNLINYSISNNIKIAMFIIKNKSYKNFIFSEKNYIYQLINKALTNGAYDIIEFLFKNKIDKLLAVTTENEIILNILNKPEKIKKFGKKQINFIHILLQHCLKNKLFDSSLNHDLLIGMMNNNNQNITFKLNKDEMNNNYVTLYFEPTYKAKDENILELLNYNINEKNLSLTQKYPEITNQNYLEKLFYQALNNSELIHEFFIKGNEKQNQYKGFKTLNEDLKIEFFNSLSENMYLINFTDQYIKEDSNFDKNKMIRVNTYQSIRKVTSLLISMIEDFNLQLFPENFFDKKATLYLKDAIKNYINTINNKVIYDKFSLLESNVEKNKLEKNIFCVKEKANNNRRKI